MEAAESVVVVVVAAAAAAFASCLYISCHYGRTCTYVRLYTEAEWQVFCLLRSQNERRGENVPSNVKFFLVFFPFIQ